MRAIPCGIFTFCLTTLCLCAIAIPTLLLGMGPPLCQDAVSATYIYIYNNRITEWAYTNQNGSDCAQYFPKYLTVSISCQAACALTALSVRPAHMRQHSHQAPFSVLAFARSSFLASLVSLRLLRGPRAALAFNMSGSAHVSLSAVYIFCFSRVALCCAGLVQLSRSLSGSA